MQFTIVALAALAATVAADYTNGTVYTTMVYTAYTTVCPAATQLTFNGITYTATTSTTLTITNCPCTVVAPVTTSAVVYCNTCVAPTTPVVVATTTPAVVVPVYVNSTTPAATTTPAKTTAIGSITAVVKPSSTPSQISANGAGKVVAFSGASLAGLVGVAAYFL